MVSASILPQSMLRCDSLRDSIMIRSIVAALALLFSACGPALAHPHVWVTMKTIVVYGLDGAAIGVRQAWTFDDMYSTFATQGLGEQAEGCSSPARNCSRSPRSMSSC